MKLYRKFRLDTAGKPIVGTKFGMLGVRPADPTNPKKYCDVSAVAGSDVVRPGEGGLSAYTDPAAIPIQVADLVLCVIDTGDLPTELNDVAAGEPHHHLEPSKEMTLVEFQEALAQTRDFWQTV